MIGIIFAGVPKRLTHNSLIILEEDVDQFMKSEKYNYLFTFSKELILISKLDLDVNLAKFMPSISVFLKKLNVSIEEEDVKSFSVFDFSKEVSKIENTLQSEKIKKDKYSIIKDLVKHISR